MLEPEPVHDLLFSSFAGVRIDGSNATIIGARPGEFLAGRTVIAGESVGAWCSPTLKAFIDQAPSAVPQGCYAIARAEAEKVLGKLTEER
jgi:hypothetical protein